MVVHEMAYIKANRPSSFDLCHFLLYSENGGNVSVPNIKNYFSDYKNCMSENNF
jgi:hypothetical protein